MADQLVIAGRAFNSRLIVGTGNTAALMNAARASGFRREMVTVACGA